MIVQHVKRRNFRPWNCGSCGKLLGLIYPNKTVTIKYKDMVLWVAGSVRTICRYCQTENTYNSETKLDDLIDQLNCTNS